MRIPRRIPRRLAVLVACAVAVVGAAWVAGSELGGPQAPTPAAGSVRLGPEPGEAVAAYLARIPASLPPPGEAVLALVQFAAPQPAAAAVAAGTPVVAVFHVPIPRVQTALRFVDLEPQVPVAAAIASAQEQAQRAAAAEAARSTGRRQAVARAEAAVLTDPGCGCVTAVVVRGDRATLDRLAHDRSVRAVEAAPAGTDRRELALSPLLGEQTARADPPPDDGAVPP